MSAILDNNADIVAIGHLVTAFQFLEAELLRITIDSCMPGNQRAVSLLASQLSFSKLTQAFSALVSALSSDGTLKESARQVASQLCQIEAERNTYVHSHYDVAEWTMRGQRILQQKHSVNLKRGYEMREQLFDPKNIDRLIEKMGMQCEGLHAIEQKLIAEGIIPCAE